MSLPNYGGHENSAPSHARVGHAPRESNIHMKPLRFHFCIFLCSLYSLKLRGRDIRLCIQSGLSLHSKRRETQWLDDTVECVHMHTRTYHSHTHKLTDHALKTLANTDTHTRTHTPHAIGWSPFLLGRLLGLFLVETAGQ